MPFLPEPPHTHGQSDAIGVLLINLGTPEAPTAPALRRYLKQFLSDRRVVELPRLLWWPILNGIILNTRPAKSAKKYASIWTSDGSPLKAHTERQAKLLQGYLGNAGNSNVKVAWAMRYGQPSIADSLQQLRLAHCRRILILPLYPQYAASTTASAYDDVGRAMQTWRNLPELRLVRSFHRDPAYIAALAASVREHWQTHGRPDKLIMSFHGLPKRSLDLGDPYFCECHVSARLLAEALNLPENAWQITFQSRFGKAQWLQPYTQDSLEKLARDGVKRVDVICPGFVADCLETLEEIAMENRAAFIAAGGKEFTYIPCLNQRPDWIQCLTGLVRQHAAEWLQTPASASDAASAQQSRAIKLGAKR